MAPSYPYKINPGQLAAMVELIDSTRSSGAAVAEIGVALPLVARETFDQRAQIVRPSGAAGERQGFEVGRVRHFHVVHDGRDSHCQRFHHPV